MKIKITSGDRTSTLVGSRYEVTSGGVLIVYDQIDDTSKVGEFKAWTEYEIVRD